jgi:tetratricopeptide (TPR) repeat protein
MSQDKSELDQAREEFGLLRSDPQKFLQLTNEEIRQNPNSPSAYLSRNWAWERLGRRDLALADLAKAISIEDQGATRYVRGVLLGKMRHYQEAIHDFDRSQALDPEMWPATPGPIHRALCHASLGNVNAALADCASLPEHHWMPSFDGAPGGNKQEVTDEIRRLATSVRDACRQRGCPLAHPADS